MAETEEDFRLEDKAYVSMVSARDEEEALALIIAEALEQGFVFNPSRHLSRVWTVEAEMEDLPPRRAIPTPPLLRLVEPDETK